jgi:hypothetical protein
MKNKLTVGQAFDVMINFLDSYYKTTKSGQINSFLSDTGMRTWSYGNRTVDPAIWEDWIECVNTDELTTVEAFKAVAKFVAMRFASKPEAAVTALIDGMRVHKDGSVATPAFWEDWTRCVSELPD